MSTGNGSLNEDIVIWKRDPWRLFSRHNLQPDQPAFKGDFESTEPWVVKWSAVVKDNFTPWGPAERMKAGENQTLLSRLGRISKWGRLSQFRLKSKRTVGASLLRKARSRHTVLARKSTTSFHTPSLRSLHSRGGSQRLEIWCKQASQRLNPTRVYSPAITIPSRGLSLRTLTSEIERQIHAWTSCPSTDRVTSPRPRHNANKSSILFQTPVYQHPQLCSMPASNEKLEDSRLSFPIMDKHKFLPPNQSRSAAGSPVRRIRGFSDLSSVAKSTSKVSLSNQPPSLTQDGSSNQLPPSSAPSSVPSGIPSGAPSVDQSKTNVSDHYSGSSFALSPHSIEIGVAMPMAVIPLGRPKLVKQEQKPAEKEVVKPHEFYSSGQHPVSQPILGVSSSNSRHSVESLKTRRKMRLIQPPAMRPHVSIAGLMVRDNHEQWSRQFDEPAMEPLVRPLPYDWRARYKPKTTDEEWRGWSRKFDQPGMEPLLRPLPKVGENGTALKTSLGSLGNRGDSTQDQKESKDALLGGLSIQVDTKGVSIPKHGLLFKPWKVSPTDTLGSFHPSEVLTPDMDTCEFEQFAHHRRRSL